MLSHPSPTPTWLRLWGARGRLRAADGVFLGFLSTFFVIFRVNFGLFLGRIAFFGGSACRVFACHRVSNAVYYDAVVLILGTGDCVLKTFRASLCPGCQGTYRTLCTFAD